MLSWIINLTFFIAIIYYGLKKVKTAVLIYCIGLFIVPIFRIRGLDLSFDVWCFPLLFSIYFFKYKKLGLNSRFVNFIPYLLVYIILSFVNAARFDCGISIATIYASIRFIITINIILEFWKDEMISFLDKLLSIVLVINVICCVIQMINAVPVKTFYDMYYKESMVPLAAQLELGYFNRAYGTTGSPVILGGIAALAYTFYFALFVSGTSKIKKNELKIGACVICGVLALSKTSILAIPIISIYLFFANILTCEMFRNKTFSKIMFLIAIGMIGLIFVFYWMQSKDLAIGWYLKYLKDPFAALDTRYNSDSGFLSKTMEVIKENILFGVGHAKFEGAFVGDSTYVVLLCHTGIVGLFAYLIPYCMAFFKTIKIKDFIRNSLIVTFLLIAIGNAMHLSYWFIPFTAMMFSTSKKTNSIILQSDLKYIIDKNNTSNYDYMI